jgi:hypothetical protein
MHEMKQQTARSISLGGMLCIASAFAMALGSVTHAQASPIPYVIDNNGGLIEPFQLQQVAVSGNFDYDPATKSFTNFDVTFTTALAFGGKYTEESEPSLLLKFGTWDINFFGTSASGDFYAIALFLSDQLGEAASYKIPYVSTFGSPDYTLLPANGMNPPAITRLTVGETETAAVPEPSTWVFVLTGVALLLLSLLRRGQEKIRAVMKDTKHAYSAA